MRRKGEMRKRRKREMANKRNRGGEREKYRENRE